LLLVKSGGESAFAEWQSCFREADPRLDVRFWTDPSVKAEDVSYVLVWEPEEGRLSQMTGLKAVFSAGAGVDHVTAVADWPRHLPLVRMGGDETVQRMGEFIVWSCLSLLRETRHFALAQAEASWAHKAVTVSAPQRRVGIMGLGNLGAAAAKMLQALNFPVQGWARSPKDIPGVRSFVGAEGLPEFLATTDILVCLLPSTPETAGLINAGLLAQLPQGRPAGECRPRPACGGSRPDRGARFRPHRRRGAGCVRAGAAAGGKPALDASARDRHAAYRFHGQPAGPRGLCRGCHRRT
jgi:glyoxylate/hydroxypyruvate reductase A